MSRFCQISLEKCHVFFAKSPPPFFQLYLGREPRISNEPWAKLFRGYQTNSQWRISSSSFGKVDFKNFAVVVQVILTWGSSELRCSFFSVSTYQTEFQCRSVIRFHAVSTKGSKQSTGLQDMQQTLIWIRATKKHKTNKSKKINGRRHATSFFILRIEYLQIYCRDKISFYWGSHWLHWLKTHFLILVSSKASHGSDEKNTLCVSLATKHTRR